MIQRMKAIGKLLIGKNLSPEESFLRGLPVDLSLSGGGSIVSAYEKSAIAYACIRRIAVDAGNAPFLLLSDPEDPDSRIPESHPVALLFNRPNPWFDTNQFMEYLYTLLGLRGEFFITFDNPASPREMIQYLDPLHWEGLINTEMRLGGWKFQHNSVGFTSLPSELIHHKQTSIRDPFRGQSPLMAAQNALASEVDGDKLTANIMGRGGEQGLVYTTDEKLLPTQEEELQGSLRARRTAQAAVANDILLTGGMTILDPKFTGFDYQLFDRMAPSEQKIIQVYGLSPSLIGRDDEPNYATFQGRLRIYWRQTLLPMMTAVESSFDEFFNHFGVFFRYDRANISGLQEDLKELSQIALILNRGGIPWEVINDRLKLGLDTDQIPGANEIMISSNHVPLSAILEEYEQSRGNPTPEPETAETPETGESDEESEGKGGDISVASIFQRYQELLEVRSSKNSETSADSESREEKELPSYETMKARAKSISSLIARNRKLAGLERAVTSAWRTLAGKYKKLASAEMDKAIRQNHTKEGAARQFADNFEAKMTKGMAEEAAEKIMPRSVQAAGEGEVSIEELVKRLSPDEIKAFSKEPAELLSPKSIAFIADRQNLVKNMPRILFENMMADIWELVEREGEQAEIGGAVRHAFNVSVNRAVTIGRTEVGTAFNVGRFNNMQEQGYAHHEWVTNIDEFTREDHADSDGEVRKVGDLFPSGLDYPQSPMGDAGQVINCRCLTIPLTEEQYEERS